MTIEDIERLEKDVKDGSFVLTGLYNGNMWLLKLIRLARWAVEAKKALTLSHVGNKTFVEYEPMHVTEARNQALSTFPKEDE